MLVTFSEPHTHKVLARGSKYSKIAAGNFGVSLSKFFYWLRAMSGADGDDGREDKNQRILHDKFIRRI